MKEILYLMFCKEYHIENDNDRLHPDQTRDVVNVLVVQ